MARLGRVVLDRLIRYYRYLADTAVVKEWGTITSARLGHSLGVDPSQVRKDFAAVGLVGMSHVGYDVCEICRTIRAVVGFDRPYTAVLVGVGRMGSAILGSPEFERYGLMIMGAFDADPAKVGQQVEDLVIQPMGQLPGFVRDRRIRLAILAVPGSAAQPLVDLLLSCGVDAFWNFTGVRVAVPPGVLARNERISAGLAEIAYHLREPRRQPEPAGVG